MAEAEWTALQTATAASDAAIVALNTVLHPYLENISASVPDEICRLSAAAVTASAAAQALAVAAYVPE